MIWYKKPYECWYVFLQPSFRKWMSSNLLVSVAQVQRMRCAASHGKHGVVEGLNSRGVVWWLDIGNWCTYCVLVSSKWGLEGKLLKMWANGKQRWEEKKKNEDQRRDRVRRKKRQQSRQTLCFSIDLWFRSWKVGSPKLQVRSHLARWHPKSCTQLHSEAHFQVKSVKNWPSPTTFGSWDVEKVHAVAERRKFPSQQCQKIDGFGELVHVQMSFCLAGGRDQKCAKRKGFVAVSSAATMTVSSPAPHLQLQLQLCYHFITLQYINYTDYITPLHYTYTTPTLHRLHSTTLH